MRQSIDMLLRRIYLEHFRGQEQPWTVEENEGIPALTLRVRLSPESALMRGTSEIVYCRIKDSNEDHLFYHSVNPDGSRSRLRCYACGKPATSEERTILISKGSGDELVSVDEERTVQYPLCTDPDCEIY